MESNDLNLTYDASATWSGYLYQGEVALYVALYCINHPEVLGCDDKKISKVKIEIEGLEDFSIIIDDKYFSIHQVKAYKSSKLSSYKEALWKLGYKLSRQKAVKAYLHTSERVNLTSFNFNLISSKISDPPKDMIELIQQTIFSLNLMNRKKLENNIFINYNSKFELVIPIGNKIEEKIIEQIKVYYEKNGTNTDSQHLQNAYRYLADFINRYIKSKHILIQQGKLTDKSTSKQASNVIINFEDLEKLLKQVPKEFSKNLIAYALRKILWEAYSFVDGYAWLNKQELASLKDNYLLQITSLENDELINLVCGLVITKNIKSETLKLEQFSLISNQEGYHEPLYSTLSKSKKNATLDNTNPFGSIYWSLIQNDITEILLATIINADKKYMNSYADDILKNSIEKLYKIKYILTAKFDGNLVENSTKYTKSSFGTDLNVEAEKINKIKNVEFISLEKALIKLNL